MGLFSWEEHKPTSANSAIQGELCENYKTICEREQVQTSKNPGHKSAFADIARLIQENCLKFTNQVNAVKVHFPKVQAKARPKKRSEPPAPKAQAAAPPKEEAESGE